VSAPLLVVDFDGTVCRGDAPVRFYAAVIADSMPAGDARDFLGAIERYLSDGPAAAAASTDTVEAAALREAVDSWGAVLSLAARGYDVPAEVIGQAFTRCREWMIDPDCAVEVVEPLLDTLADLRGDARIVLVTNSPRDSMLPLLRRLGILDAFDDIVAGAGKPDGLRRFLQRSLGPDLRARPWRLFSIGDHYRNDIEPAVELGAAAGYIDRFGRADGPATARARRAEDLLPVLRAWAADPDGRVRHAALAGRGESGTSG
jgi:FMN phosphatase YigB (HAD superfamily)